MSGAASAALDAQSGRSLIHGEVVLPRSCPCHHQRNAHQLQHTSDHEHRVVDAVRAGHGSVVAASVRAELLEKVLAYNFCRMAGCRRDAREHERLAA